MTGSTVGRGPDGGTDVDSLTEIRLRIAAAPHLRSPHSTPRIMWNVVGSLVPILAVAVYYFGPSALLVIAAATIGAVLTELLFGTKSSTADGSAVITGLLLGLILPPGFPLWMAFLGGVFGIGFGKLIFGGLGQNVFNPALLGRAFLQAAFPLAITTWPVQPASWWSLRGDNFALPLMSPSAPDVVTGATPLGLMKFEGLSTNTLDLMIGSTGGSIGETAGLLILVCGGYLALRKYLDWRIPLSIFLTVRRSLAARPRSLSEPRVHAVLRRSHARRNVHGYGHGHVSRNSGWILDVRHRRRPSRRPHPGMGRPAGRGDVRHPVHERAGPVIPDRPGLPR